MCWRVQPPTSLNFVKHMCPLLLRDACTPQDRGQLAGKSNLLVELSVIHGDFVGYNRLTITLSSIEIPFNLSGNSYFNISLCFYFIIIGVVFLSYALKWLLIISILYITVYYIFFCDSFCSFFLVVYVSTMLVHNTSY